MKKLFNVVSLVLLLSMVLTAVVFADNLQTDTILADGYVDLGSVCQGATVSRDILFRLRRTGQPFVGYGTLILHGDDPSNGFTRALGSDVTIDLPDGWADLSPSSNALTTDTATGIVGITAGTELGVLTGIATFRAVDQDSNNATHGVQLKATVVECQKAYYIDGYYRPVDMDADYNTVKGGSTVPLKFRVYEDDTMAVMVTPDSEGFTWSKFKFFSYLADASVDFGDLGEENAITEQATGGTGLRWDPVEEQFIFNWKTPKAKGELWTAAVKYDNSNIVSADFLLK